jgi:hypothetical protein
MTVSRVPRTPGLRPGLHSARQYSDRDVCFDVAFFIYVFVAWSIIAGFHNSATSLGERLADDKPDANWR